MALGEIQHQLNTLVKNLCKNRLNFDSGFRFEGLLGITLDDTSVLLLNINDSFRKTEGGQLRHKSCLSLKNKATGSAIAPNLTSVNGIDTSLKKQSTLHCDLTKSGTLATAEGHFTPLQLPACEQVITDSNIPIFNNGVSAELPHSVPCLIPSVAATGQQKPAENFIPEITNKESGFQILDGQQNGSFSSVKISMDEVPGFDTQPDQTTSEHQARVLSNVVVNGTSSAAEGKDNENCMTKEANNQKGFTRLRSRSEPINQGTAAAAGVAVTAPKANGLIGQGTIEASQSEDRVRWFRCDLCSYQSRFKKNLKRHLFTHESVGFPCKTCKKHFRDVTMLAEHIRVTHDNVSISCSECGKGFKTRRALQYHRQKHSGQFKYSCAVCGKKFATTTHYSDHMNTHSGTREVCDCCGRSFQYKSSYNKHLRVGCKPANPPIVPITQQVFPAPQDQLQIIGSSNSGLPFSPEEKTGHSGSSNNNKGGQFPSTKLAHQCSENPDNNVNMTGKESQVTLAQQPTLATNLTPQDVPPKNLPMEQGTKAGFVQVSQAQSAPHRPINGDLSFNDSFIERIASSLASTESCSESAGNKPDADPSFGFQDLMTGVVVEGEKDGKSLTQLKADLSQKVFDVPMQVGVYSTGGVGHIPLSNTSHGDSQNLTQQATGTSQSFPSADPEIKSDFGQAIGQLNKNAATCGARVTTENHISSNSMDVTNSMESVPKKSESPIQWPSEDVVLYRFPMLEGEYAMQAANREQSMPKSSEQSTLTPTQRLPPRPEPSTLKLSSDQDVSSGHQHQETYYIYPLPEHCYDSDSLSACLSGVGLNSPHLLSNQDLSGTNKPADTAGVSNIASVSNTAAVSNTAKPTAINNNEIHMADSGGKRDETSIAVHNLVALHSDADQTRGDLTKITQDEGGFAQHDVSYPSPPEVNQGGDESMKGEEAVQPSFETSGTNISLDVNEEFIGAIYPQFPEHMPPNIFDEDS